MGWIPLTVVGLYARGCPGVVRVVGEVGEQDGKELKYGVVCEWREVRRPKTIYPTI